MELLQRRGVAGHVERVEVVAAEGTGDGPGAGVAHLVGDLAAFDYTVEAAVLLKGQSIAEPHAAFGVERDTVRVVASSSCAQARWLLSEPSAAMSNAVIRWFQVSATSRTEPF